MSAVADGDQFPDGTRRGSAPDRTDDALWVRSFLLTQPGKAYQVEVSEDGRDAVAREGAESAARALTDAVLRQADLADPDRPTGPPGPTQPS